MTATQSIRRTLSSTGKKPRRRAAAAAAAKPAAPPPGPSPELARLRAEAVRLIAMPDPSEDVASHFDSQPVGFVLTNENGIIQWTNHRLQNMTGYSNLYLRATNFSRFFPQDDVPVLLDHFRRARQQGIATALALSLKMRTGRLLRVELTTASGFDSQEGPCFRTCVVDATERHTATTRAQETRYRYQTLLDTLEGVVWEAEGPELAITFVNSYARKLLGYSSDDWLLPGYWENHIHVDDRDRVMHRVSRALKDNASFSVDYRVLTSDRRVLWLHDSVNVEKVAGKLRLLGVAVDVTEQKEAERKLQTAQSYLEASVAERTAQLRETITDLEAFSYSMSHDLRAPLRAIQGYSELLEQGLREHLDPTQREFFERIKNSTTRMDSLIQDVLTYSRVARSPLLLQPVDVEEVLKNVIRDYPGLQPPHAEIKIEKPLARISGHPAFLSQAISNLLWNAVKFVSKGKHPRIRVRTVPAHEDVEIWFEDNGIGIARENQKRIFGIFQRLNSDKTYEGTGIGLAIVQKAVERMGGRVGVESKPGQGSKFWLRLHGVAQ